jgi:hypothetical protein
MAKTKIVRTSEPPSDTGERAEAGVRKEMTSTERRTGFNLKILWDFEGTVNL